MKKFILVLSLLVFSMTANAHVNDSLCSDFVETTGLKISISAKNKGKTTEQQFHDVIDRVTEFSRPQIEAQGFTLSVLKNWKSGNVYGEAKQDGLIKHVNIFGGIARHKRMDADSFAIVVCHEFGHHLAGGHKMTKLTWSSVEGQADYYAVSKCLRQLWKDENNQEVVSKIADIPEPVREKCHSAHVDSQAQSLCLRSQMASLRVAQLLHDLTKPGGGRRMSSFETPDQSIVSLTLQNHPKAQCRLDTYVAASLCKVPETETFDDHDIMKGACRFQEQPEGARPRCWFAEPNPSKSELPSN